MTENEQKLQNQIDELKKQITALSNYSTIPIDTANAFKIRILANNSVSGRSVTGTPSTVTINESGSATVIAQAPLTGKLGITIDNVEYIVPII